MVGQCPLCKFQGFKKFFLEDDSGMSRSSVGWNHIFLPICLVIVHDFDIISVGSYPAKHDAPLGIDSNAVKSVEIAMESFQPVSGRHAKIIQTGGGVEEVQFTQGGIKDFWGISSNLSARNAVEQGRSGAISK